MSFKQVLLSYKTPLKFKLTLDIDTYNVVHARHDDNVTCSGRSASYRQNH